MNNHNYAVLAWYQAMADAYDKTMTSSQREELLRWETENQGCKNFFSSNWLGWKALIGEKPSASSFSSRDESGYIYLIRCGETQLYKIGKAKEVTSRLAGLQTGNPLLLSLIGTYSVLDATNEESELHLRFKDKHERGEWFTLSSDDVAWFLLRANLSANQSQ